MARLGGVLIRESALAALGATVAFDEYIREIPMNRNDLVMVLIVSTRNELQILSLLSALKACGNFRRRSAIPKRPSEIIGLG